MKMHRPSEFDTSELRDVLGRFATGVTVVTTCDSDGAPVGLTVNSFASVSLEPAEILWSIRSDALSRPCFEAHGAFAVNVMAAEAKEESLQFARPAPDKFAGIGWTKGWRDVPVLDAAIATLECDTKQMIPCGDHHIIVGSVRGITCRDGKPLVFFRGQFTSLDTAI